MAKYPLSRIQPASLGHMRAAAHRAASDPDAVARSLRVIQAAVERGVLDRDELLLEDRAYRPRVRQ